MPDNRICGVNAVSALFARRLGNEEFGILPEVLAACRRRIRIESCGPVVVSQFEI